MAIEVKQASFSELREAEALFEQPEQRQLLRQRRPDFGAFYSHLGSAAHFFVAKDGHQTTAALGCLEQVNGEGGRYLLVADLAVRPEYRFGLSYPKLVDFFCHWFLRSGFDEAVALEARRGRLAGLSRLTPRYGVSTVSAGNSRSVFFPLRPLELGALLPGPWPLQSLSAEVWQRFLAAYGAAQAGNFLAVQGHKLKERILSLDSEARVIFSEQLQAGAILVNASGIRQFHSAWPTGAQERSLKVLQLGLSFGAAEALVPPVASWAFTAGYELIYARDIEIHSAFTYEQRVLSIKPIASSSGSRGVRRYLPDPIFC